LTDVETAVGEAVSSAVDAGTRRDEGMIVRAQRAEHGLVIEIQAEGQGFEAFLRDLGRRMRSPRGYGVRIMTALMDSVEFSDRDRRIRLTKLLHEQASTLD